MAKVTVGAFSMEGGVVSGPKAFMEEEGFALMRKIERGESVVFNMGLAHSPNVETLVLVTLQTAYAGWKGAKQVEGWCRAAKKGA